MRTPLASRPSPSSARRERLLPAGGRVANYHQLCDLFARATGLLPDYADPQVWQQLEAHLGQSALPPDWRFDVLIVDEGQDFSEGWRDALLRLLKDGGRALWLEDPLQNLYAREPVALPGWVTLHADSNFRSPRQVVQMLTALSPVPTPSSGCSRTMARLAA